MKVPRTAGLRVGYFWATWEVVLAAFLSRQPSALSSTLPEDAQVHHIVLDEHTRRVQVFFTSASLEVVPEGGVIPEFVPVLSYRAVAEPKRRTRV